MKKTMRYALAAAALAALAGCENKQQTTTEPGTPPDQPVTANEVGERYKDAAAATKDYVMQNKDAFVASAEAKLQALDAKLQELGAKAASLKDDAKAQADQTLAELREQREKLNGQFAALKQAGTNAWEQVKTGFETALTKLEAACEEARSKFN